MHHHLLQKEGEQGTVYELINWSEGGGVASEYIGTKEGGQKPMVVGALKVIVLLVPVHISVGA